MRTIDESTEQVRVWIRDTVTVNAAWTPAQIQAVLRASADTIFDLFLNDPRANSLLAALSFPFPTRANQVSYKLPAGCKLITGVEYRQDTSLWGVLYCGATPKTVHTNWTGVTAGCFGVMMDGAQWNVYSVNLSTATSMTSVASLLQTALRAACGGLPTITWDAANTRFVFSCYDEPGMLVPVPFPGAGTELSGSLYLNGDQTSTATVDLSSRPAVYFTELPRLDGERSLPSYASGAQALYPSRSAIPGVCLSWSAAKVPGYVRLDPVPIQANGLLRFHYLKHPTFPTVTTRGFDLPDGFDDLMELHATARISHEELEDPKPMGYFGQMFRDRYSSYVRGAGGATAPVRGYVESASGR